MNAAERREQILTYLQRQTAPVSASALARQFSVSRQIIVGDVALLRAGGATISATPRGYLLAQRQSGLLRQVACNHTAEQMEDELTICVDQGCSVLDVIVEHPVYGQLAGQLQLHSRYDVQQFLQRVRQESAHSLSELTDGIHLHTLRCPSEDAYRRVCAALDRAGYLLKEEE
ncbi:MAG: transcription repressor NadR [Clostridiales bacterium]|nr:transcription repressor NadR [Oscillospiraceae bacterium]MCD8334365.1 transcription repressor NadR [Clostridiales bacterium]